MSGAVCGVRLGHLDLVRIHTAPPTHTGAYRLSGSAMSRLRRTRSAPPAYRRILGIAQALLRKPLPRLQPNRALLCCLPPLHNDSVGSTAVEIRQNPGFDGDTMASYHQVQLAQVLDQLTPFSDFAVKYSVPDECHGCYPFPGSSRRPLKARHSPSQPTNRHS